MKISFYKYQGTGNDFIIIDDRQDLFPKDDKIIVELCDRKFGIGSDGIILIKQSKESDFYMEFFNPDASRSFCGNGSRCAIAFAYKMGIIDKTTHFQAIDGDHYGEILDDNSVKVNMKKVEDIRRYDDDLILDTGSPHFVRFVKKLNNEDIVDTGRKIRYSKEFEKEGINVNLVEIDANSELLVATYERGVENETLSCGTGVTAMALAANFRSEIPSPIKVHTRGGELEVEFQYSEGSYENVYLIGPAKFVYKGEVQI